MTTPRYYELKAEHKALKENTFQQIRHLTRDADMIRLSGFKSLEDAVKKLIADYDKKSHKIECAMEDQLPD